MIFYLKDMKGHLLMIDCERFLYKLFYFCIKILLQMDVLSGAMD
jgi:hypothetical protein